MATVLVPSPLRPLCAGAAVLEAAGATLGEVLRAVDERCPGFYGRTVEDGRLRPELAVALNGHAHRYGLSEPVAPDDEVAIVPAIGGGAELGLIARAVSSCKAGGTQTISWAAG